MGKGVEKRTGGRFSILGGSFQVEEGTPSCCPERTYEILRHPSWPGAAYRLDDWTNTTHCLHPALMSAKNSFAGWAKRLRGSPTRLMIESCWARWILLPNLLRTNFTNSFPAPCPVFAAKITTMPCMPIAASATPVENRRSSNPKRQVP